ncbi:LolA family protein [Marinoscillum furvescens]|uniref:Outer membrane lipoprotein-sorting protein n=1 Tax=Marinoscillum furvescens DSM 4134 TaxID=1122208 RepID=A0A3D9LIS3_MARFU|nr:outer membrane lipoprotein carrier protein LolA [Marinoscillum furvescens]REE05765.1 outer membrane lipoprotein-sorting protein [Marinoscillum furvescens DSM 4134]
MKRIIVATLTAVMAWSASAQYDPEARAVLDAMSSKYKDIGTYSADFTQELVNESAEINETISGSITVKDDKYRLQVAGQEIYNNGTNVYSYSEEFNEVTISPYEPENEEITLGNIYDLYKDGFKYALMSINGQGDRIVELDPVSKDKSYFKIRLVIDSQDNLKKFTVFERSGNKYIYTINEFTKKEDVSDDYFTFDTKKNKGVEVIDFR